MPKHNMFKRHTRQISTSLIQQYLNDFDAEDDVDQDTIHDESPRIGTSHSENREFDISEGASTDDLLGCKAWLDQLCEHERALNSDINWLKGHHQGNPFNTTEGRGARHNLTSEYLSMGVGVLQRIRNGRGPRNPVLDGLLAPLRGNSLQDNGAKTYDEMKEVLLAWTGRILGNLKEEKDVRAMLKLASEEDRPLRLLNCALIEKQAPDNISMELLDCLTALRPEIASFNDDDYFGVLLTIWANVRVAIPDLGDDLQLLTMKVLIDGVESRSPRSEVDLANIKQSEVKSRESTVGRPTDKVKNVRGELVHVKLKETQELTILQAAQKWAAHEKLSKTRSWREQRRACDQAGSELQRILQHQVPDLDAHVRFAQSNAKAQAEMSAGLLSRALEAGFFLEDKSTSMPQELEKFALETYLFGSMTDILYAREEAAKMLARMDTVGRGLDAFLDAASSQYREYEGHSDFLNPAASFSADGDAEVQLAEKYGPRRESVLLMIRGQPRPKDLW